MNTTNSQGKTRVPYMVAMVLGTALAALGSSERAAAGELSERALGGMSRYCSACWRNARLPADRWGDCTQEVLTRLLQRVPVSGWNQVLAHETEERREFLRAIDTVKKRHQRERARSTVLNRPVADVRDGIERQASEDRQVLFQAAGRILSDRQQRILRLICEGYSISEIAEALDLSPERVSDEKYKAIQKLRLYFESHPEAA
jgi:RNA polymerase sigma factor (sigma-70 family)